MTNALRCTLAVSLPLVVLACAPNLSIGKGQRPTITCTTSADCPAGYRCSSQLTVALPNGGTSSTCVPPNQDDTPPTISNLQVSGGVVIGSDQFFKAGSTIAVSFDSDEPLGAPPDLTLTFTNRVEELTGSVTPQSDGSYIIDYTVGAADGDGPVSLTLSVVDTVGNPRTVDRPNELIVDKVPPALGSLVPTIYRPDPTNPLFPDVRAATAGTDVQLSLIFQEPLQKPPTVRATNAAGCTVDFTLSQDLNPFYVFDLMVTDAAASACPSTYEGYYDVTIDALDRAANAAEFTGSIGPNPTATGNDVDLLDFVIDLTPPSPSYLSFTRIPWGRRDASGNAQPKDTYLFSGTMTVGSCSDPICGTFIVFSDAAGTAEIKRATVDSSGTLTDLDLTMADQPQIFAEAVDPAGNASPVTLVGNATWVASLGGRQQGNPFSNPNRLTTGAVARAAQRDPNQTEPITTELQKVYPGGTGGLIVRGDRTWVQRPQEQASGVSFASMVYISSTDQALSVGGADPSFGAAGLWHFDGATWRQIDLTNLPNPGERLAAGLAYDSVRDRVVLLGGSLTLGLSADTWEWDGTQWLNVTPSTPGPADSFLSPLAYDSARGVTVDTTSLVAPDSSGQCTSGAYFPPSGRCVESDLWEWDGSNWQPRCLASQNCASPPARFGNGLVYDPGSGRVILFGGVRCDPTDPTCAKLQELNDTWSWDGSAWTELTPSTQPPARMAPVMAYDQSIDVGGSQAGAIILFGGCSKFNATGELRCDPGSTGSSELDDMWALVNDNWVQLSNRVVDDGGPAARAFAEDAYDSGSQRLLVRGGAMTADCSGLTCPENAAMQADSSNLCTCVFERTWALANDGSWSVASSATDAPANQNQLSMAYDAVAKRTVLFGGHVDSLANCDAIGGTDCHVTWEYDGALWSPVHTYDPASPTGPCDRNGQGMANVSDGASHSLSVVVGGYNPACSSPANPTASSMDVWGWDATTTHAWVELFSAASGATQPPPRRNFAMAGAGNAIYVQGGVDPSSGTTLGDFWKGTVDFTKSTPTLSWTQLTQPANMPPGPSPRAHHAMAYDSLRNKLVLFGGCDTSASPAYIDCASGATMYSGTWEWDLSQGGWTQRTPVNSPPGTAQFAMTYDSGRGRTLVQGGVTAGGVFQVDLWEWNGTDWSVLNESGAKPTARRLHAMSYDSDRHVAVLLGGGAPKDVWELNLDPQQKPAMVAQFAWDAAGVESASTPSLQRDAVQQITLTVAGSATGYSLDLSSTPIGAPVDGMRIEAWDGLEARWHALGDAALAPCAHPAGAAANVTQCHFVDAATAQRFLVGANNRFIVRLTPTAGSGNGPAPAEVSLDYIEAAIDYHLDNPL